MRPRNIALGEMACYSVAKRLTRCPEPVNRPPETSRRPCAPSRSSTRSPREASSGRPSLPADGHQREHGLTPARHADARRAGRARRGNGRYRLGVRVLRLANAVLGRLNLRDVARPHLEELVRRGRRGGDALDSGRRGRDHGRLRPERPLPPGRHAPRPAERRPCLVGRQGDARVRRRPAAAREARRRTRRGRSPTGRARRGDRARARAGWAEAVEEREVGLSAIAAPVWGAGRRARRDRRPAGPDEPLRRDGDRRRAAAPARLRAANLRRPRVARVESPRAVRLSRWRQ